MTKRDIEQALWESLALDYNCAAEDFIKPTKKVTENILVPGRRMYNLSPAAFSLMSNGRSIIVNCESSLRDFAEEFIKDSPAEWVSEFSRLAKIETELNRRGLNIVDMHEFYLPLPNFPSLQVPSDVEIKWYSQREILQFKGGPWKEAYAFNENYPDMIGLSAAIDGKLVAMAGASRDWEKLWQIGIDVLPEAGGCGLGALLTCLIKEKILSMGIVPFYGTAVSHMASQNVARKAGFYPAWMELFSGQTPLAPSSK